MADEIEYIPSDQPTGLRWEGFAQRECSEHYGTGHRAWCFDCHEWCYQSMPCKGCEIPILRARIAELEAERG